jgi:hypothetical protein
VTAPGVGGEAIAVALEQRYQYVTGAANAAGQRITVNEGRLDADQVRFRLALPGGLYEFRGKVTGDRMSGTAVHAGRSTPWSAIRE